MSLFQFLLVDCCVRLTVTWVMVATLSGWLLCHRSLSPLPYCSSWLLVLSEIGPKLSALFSQLLISFKVDCWIFAADLGKTTGNRWDFMQVLREKWKNTMNSPFFDPQTAPLLPTFMRDRRSERPELAGSKMALLFLPDHQNSVMSEIRVHNLAGRRTQWFFHPM